LPEVCDLAGLPQREVRRRIRRRRREPLRTMRGSVPLKVAAHLAFARPDGLIADIKAGCLRARPVNDPRGFLVDVVELVRYLDELELRIEASEEAGIERYQSEKADHIRRKFGAPAAQRYLARARGPR
jgi:hypothetical protein